MEKRAIRTGLELTVIGLGGAQFGNLYREMSEDEVTRTVELAWENGVRYFDTAPHYGMGLSERRLGKVLQQYPRDEYVLSTKVGRLIRDNPGGTGTGDEGYFVPNTTKRVLDYSGDGVRKSIEESLDRLGIGRIDIAFLHDPDDYWESASQEGAPALAELRDQGVINAFGAGMNQSEMIARFIRECDADVVMLAGRYTLLEQGANAEVFPACEETGAKVVIAGVHNSGLLARPRPNPDSHYNYEKAPTELIERANQLADLTEKYGVSLPQAAVNFPLTHPHVVSVSVGASKASQFRESLDRVAAGVPAEMWAELVESGLVDTTGLQLPGAAS
ncbi:MAG: aldo/keto reductase [Propionibacteriaceae bacterium]|nr:aldo/keto reductase [Propionibacteriaceae bacterium]